jgi:hypothetical protein
MNSTAANYYSHDVDDIRVKFLSFNAKFFRSLYFDFAPLFSVPAYMDEPCSFEEDDRDYYTNFPYYDHEMMANAIGEQYFAHPETSTDSILKTAFVKKVGESDIVEVTAFSYATIERIDYVPVYGGDGNYHNVPVPWIEYIPVSKVSHVVISNASSPKDCTSVYYHGMGAGIMND